jgi:hypothetical protein
MTLFGLENQGFRDKIVVYPLNDACLSICFMDFQYVPWHGEVRPS